MTSGIGDRALWRLSTNFDLFWQGDEILQERIAEAPGRDEVRPFNLVVMGAVVPYHSDFVGPVAHCLGHDTGPHEFLNLRRQCSWQARMGGFKRSLKRSAIHRSGCFFMPSLQKVRFCLSQSFSYILRNVVRQLSIRQTAKKRGDKNVLPIKVPVGTAGTIGAQQFGQGWPRRVSARVDCKYQWFFTMRANRKDVPERVTTALISWGGRTRIRDQSHRNFFRVALNTVGDQRAHRSSVIRQQGIAKLSFSPLKASISLSDSTSMPGKRTS